MRRTYSGAEIAILAVVSIYPQKSEFLKFAILEAFEASRVFLSGKIEFLSKNWPRYVVLEDF